MISVGGFQRLKRIYAGGTKLRAIWATNAAGVATRIYYALQTYAGSTGQNELPAGDQWIQYHSFRVTGNGPGVLTVSFSWGSNGLHWVTRTRWWRMQVNGVDVNGELSQNFSSGGWDGTHSGTVNFRDGDLVTLWGIGSPVSYASCRTVISRAINITPT